MKWIKPEKFENLTKISEHEQRILEKTRVAELEIVILPDSKQCLERNTLYLFSCMKFSLNYTGRSRVIIIYQGKVACLPVDCCFLDRAC